MSRESEIAMEHSLGPSNVGKNIDRSYPTHDEIAQLACSLYEFRSRQEGHQMEDWLPPNRNPCTTTRDCEENTARIEMVSIKRKDNP